MKIYIFTVLILITLICKSQNERITKWHDDIQYLKTELPKRHFNLFFKLSKEEFENELDYITMQIEQLDDFEIALKIQQLITKLGDSHTNVGYGNFIDKNKILPFRLLWFNDGIFFFRVNEGNNILIGKKINKINGFGINQIIDSLSTLITVDNQAIIKKNIVNMLTSIQLLEFFEFVSGNIMQLEIESSDGEIFKHEIYIDSLGKKRPVSLQTDTIPFTLLNPRMFFRDIYFKNEGVYYLQYNKCWSKELEELYGKKDKAYYMPSFKEFEQNVFNTIETKPVDKLIIDLRHNSGGNSLQGTEFITKLSKYKIINQKGKLFVIVGRRTFSSAILNVMDFKRLTHAILVGEETSGKPNHFGEVKSFRLPSSGLIVEYSTKYFKRTDKEINSIIPDYVIEMNYTDFIKGIDPVYDWIINYR